MSGQTIDFNSLFGYVENTFLHLKQFQKIIKIIIKPDKYLKKNIFIKNLGEDKAAECPGAKAEAPSSPTRRRVKKAD